MRNAILGLAILLVAAGAARAQSAPTIKRHSVGESNAKFFAKEPELKAWMDYCQKPDDAKGEKPPILKQPFLFDDDAPPRYASLCKWLSPIAQGDRVELTATETGATWTLASGGVVSVAMLVPATNEAALEDAIRKFGQPTAHTKAAFQNSFGATWSSRVVVWDRPTFYAVLYQDGNPAGDDKGPYLKVETRTERAREAKEAAHQPKPLD